LIQIPRRRKDHVRKRKRELMEGREEDLFLFKIDMI
jgi:hypothetical protein